MAIQKRYICTVDGIRIYRVTEPDDLNPVRFIAYQDRQVIADERFIHTKGDGLTVKAILDEFIRMAKQKKI